MSSESFYFNLLKLLLPSLLKDNFTGNRILGWWLLFSVNTLNISFMSPLAFMVSEDKLNFISSGFFQDFLIFDLYFQYCVPQCRFFFCFCLAFISKLTRFVVLVSDINSGKILIVSNICFVPFFSFWYSCYTYVTPSAVVLQFLDILGVLFAYSTFSLLFSFRDF